MKSHIKRRNPAKIKFFLYFVIAVICVSVVGVFVNYRYLSEKESIFTSMKNKASLSLAQVDHTQTKAGIKQWRLRSGTVNYYQDENKAIFTDLNVIIYSKDNSETVLTAKQGQLNTETNDITANGNVKVVSDDVVFETEVLDYKNKERAIRSNVPVKFVKNRSLITADTIHLDIDTHITTLKGHVKGIFSETH